MSPKKKIRYIEQQPETIIRYQNADRTSPDESPVMISLEEFEALRLYYYKGLPQNDCKDRLNISQPTFSRILRSANAELVKALVEGRDFQIMGGNVGYKEWVGWSCWDCDSEWKTDVKPEKCPECNSSKVFQLKNLVVSWE